MTRRRSGFLGIFLFLLGVSFAHAQQKFQLSGFFDPVFPQGDFKQEVGEVAYGGSINFAARIPHSIFWVGASIGYNVYGYESRLEPFSLTIPDVLVAVKTTNALFSGHLFLRIQPGEGNIRPYLDGLVGLFHLTTDTRVDNGRGFDNEDSPGTNHWRDTVLSYGLGGGLLINLFNPGKVLRSGLFSIGLDLGFRYLKGGNAEYLTEGAIEIRYGEIIYYVSETHTDLISLRAGITFSF